ncbi:MAG: histone deacetylase [Actinomycetes bacterium]
MSLPGTVYFALESPTWTGGLALYDPSADGTAAARAYLVTVSQFVDLAVQEMHREPGSGPDSPVLAALEALASADGSTADGSADGSDGSAAARRQTVGPGRYETLAGCGAIEGVPVVTFTAPWTVDEVRLNAPSAAYVRTLANGLHQAYGWQPGGVTDYLLSLPGVAPTWDVAGLVAVMAQSGDNSP